MATGSSEVESYDILLLGKTGRGKSTLGNTILIDGGDGKLVTISNLDDVSKEGQKNKTADFSLFSRFRTATDCPSTETMFSVTENCEIATNTKSRIRVVDTPGFADTKGIDQVYLANLQIIRKLVRLRNQLAECKENLKVSRVVYFLPERGSLEKADANLQEELKVMHYYFGNDIFKCMVIVATQQARYQEYKYDEEECTKTKKTVTCAIKKAIATWPTDTDDSPPVVYIGLNDSHNEVVSKIKNAKVIDDSNKFFLEVVNVVCLRCSGKRDFTKAGDLGFKSNDEADIVKVEESMCHPVFYRRSGTGEKFIGSIAHLVTFGIPYVLGKAFGRETWAGATNKDEICPICKQFPGTIGCSKVHTEVEFQRNGSKTTIMVNHTDYLDD